MGRQEIQVDGGGHNALVGPAELGRAAAEVPEQVILLPRPDPDEAGRRPPAP